MKIEPKLNITLPFYWNGEYDLSNVIDMGNIRYYADLKKHRPFLTWELYLCELDEICFYEDRMEF